MPKTDTFPPGEESRFLSTILQEAPVSERAARIAASDRVAALVPRIPPLELLFALKAAAPEDALTLLSHARPSQVRFALDLELWKREEVSPSRARRWMRLFEGLDDAVLERWAKTLGLEDLAPLFGRAVRATLADEDGLPEKDDARGETSFTLDGVHYFTCAADLAPFARRMLTFLHRQAPGTYARLLELLLVGFGVEDEEEAHSLRQARLAEWGFAEFGEAQRLYVPLPPEDMASMPLRRAVTAVEEPPAYEAPAFPLPALSSPDFCLRDVLEACAAEGDASELLRQIGHLASLAVAADALDPSEADSYLGAADKVAGLLSIGLELLHGADREAMARTVRSRWLEHVARVGVWRLNRLSALAREMIREGWPQGNAERLALLDPPLPEAVRAAAAKRPHRMMETPEGFQRADFASLREVALAERQVAQARFLGTFLLSLLQQGEMPEERITARLEGEPLKARAIFLTALCRAALGHGLRFAPLTPEQAAEALELLFAAGGPPRRVRPEFPRALAAWAAQTLSPSEQELLFLEEFLGDAVRHMEEEFGHLPEGETPDPRFLQGVWIA